MLISMVRSAQPDGFQEPRPLSPSQELTRTKSISQKLNDLCVDVRIIY